MMDTFTSSSTNIPAAVAAQTGKRSFSQRLISNQGHLVYLVLGKDHTGNQAFYYVLVDGMKLEAFLRAFDRADMELTDYGKIIASGYGSEPTEAVRRELKEKYGFDC